MEVAGRMALKAWGNARVCHCLPGECVPGPGPCHRTAAHGAGARGRSRSLQKNPQQAQHNHGSLFMLFLCPLKL